MASRSDSIVRAFIGHLMTFDDKEKEKDENGLYGKSGSGVDYVSGDLNKPIESLKDFYSNSEIKRLKDQKSIKTWRDPVGSSVWIKVGKHYFIVKEGELMSHWASITARMWWEYHHQLMPKEINWEVYE